MTDEEKQTVGGLVHIESPVIREDMDYDIQQLKTNMATITTNFNADQKDIYHHNDSCERE